MGGAESQEMGPPGFTAQSRQMLLRTSVLAFVDTVYYLCPYQLNVGEQTTELLNDAHSSVVQFIFSLCAKPSSYLTLYMLTC